MEYKVFRDTDENVQKLLNQWKHKYTINIIRSTPLAEGRTYIVLTRTPK